MNPEVIRADVQHAVRDAFLADGPQDAPPILVPVHLPPLDLPL